MTTFRDDNTVKLLVADKTFQYKMWNDDEIVKIIKRLAENFMTVNAW